jgi:ferritin-like protein
LTSPDLDVQDVIERLDSFYCYNVVASLWADAVANRLQGMALYLLVGELEEVADHARTAAQKLAERIGDLGGAITADPRQLINRAPGDDEFTIPDCSDPGSIVTYALQRLNVVIPAYQAFLDLVRGHDDISFSLVVGLLERETHRRANAEAVVGRAPETA